MNPEERCIGRWRQTCPPGPALALALSDQGTVLSEPLSPAVNEGNGSSGSPKGPLTDGEWCLWRPPPQGPGGLGIGPRYAQEDRRAGRS